MAHKLYKSTLIIDEGHNALNMLQDLSAVKLWKHDYHFPSRMYNYADILRWVEGIPAEDIDSNLRKLREELVSTRPRYVLKLEYDLYRRTKEPEQRLVLKMIPVDVRDAAPHLWPSRVRKIVIMSATISRKDIEAMGLDKRRVTYLEAPSPIPVESRPINPVPLISVSRSNLESASRIIGEYIQRELLPRHTGEKGVIHTTYGMASLLSRYLTSDRFIFHGRDDVFAKYEEYKAAKGDAVFVCSGLDEGIDLIDDLGRWQVIAKIPYPSLGDPAIRFKLNEDPDWYTWNTLKHVIQACGRICRSPTDFGVTYVLDGTFRRLYDQAVEAGLAPRWWREAIIWS